MKKNIYPCKICGIEEEIEEQTEEVVYIVCSSCVEIAEKITFYSKNKQLEIEK